MKNCIEKSNSKQQKNAQKNASVATIPRGKSIFVADIKLESSKLKVEIEKAVGPNMQREFDYSDEGVDKMIWL